MLEKRSIVETHDGPMTTVVFQPEGDGPFPVVVCYHHGPGLDELMFSTARRLAGEGYYTALPDLYHRIGELITFDREELANNPNSPETERVMSAMVSTTPEFMVEDTRALVQALDAEPAARKGPKACIGFCHSARAVVRAMAEMPEEFAAGSLLHPSMMITDDPDSPHLFVKKICGEIYAGFGAQDRLAPLMEQGALIDELRALGPRAVVEMHFMAGHGYMWPETPGYDPDASVSSWNKTLEIFGRHLHPQRPKETTA
ncbi:dienelactone hydrolase family protein [Mycobacterium sp.]|uniref:dienelactone hydrolase family protein n=1 Tax=Mycobacterium sp. TaxID=1785 RepID=UPI002B6C8025|nr:dienelactone hydrolase family protein [Mycobacterium sp.]HKP41586.1 dienelactone hydrolase family protein [Mycobacterium sp.]